MVTVTSKYYTVPLSLVTEKVCKQLPSAGREEKIVLEESQPVIGNSFKIPIVSKITLTKSRVMATATPRVLIPLCSTSFRKTSKFTFLGLAPKMS